MGDEESDEVGEIQAPVAEEVLDPEPPTEEKKPPKRRKGGVLKQLWR